jgi:hypothetical protein
MGEDILDWDLENWGGSGINFFSAAEKKWRWSDKRDPTFFRPPKKSGGERKAICVKGDSSDSLDSLAPPVFQAVHY